MKTIAPPALFLATFFTISVFGQQSSPKNADHYKDVNARGDQGMGFSHELTTHHFHLLADGGAIEIQTVPFRSLIASAADAAANCTPGRPLAR
jgi:hypothetical protein